MTDSLSEIKPGQPMTEEQRLALGKDNAKASEEAQRLAAEHKARDMEAGGNEKPVQQSVADSVRQKLEREEFSTLPADSSNSAE